MNTKKLFNYHVHGLWDALQNFAAEKKILLTPKGNKGHGVTLSLKQGGKKVEIGKVTVSGDNWFHFSYTTDRGQPACFGYTSPRTGIEQCMSTVRRHAEEAAQPKTPAPVVEILQRRLTA